MANYSRTRTSPADLLAFIQARLAAVTTLDVQTFHVSNEDELFNYLATIQPENNPVAAISMPVVIRKNEPQSVYVFHVYVITKDCGSRDIAMAENITAVSSVYDAIDFQLYPETAPDPINGSPALFFADRDDHNDIEKLGKNTVYRCTFYVEDN